MLLILVFQYTQENRRQREMIGNLTQEHHILQNDSYLKKLLTYKTLEYNLLKNELLQQKKERDLLFTNRTCQRENKGMKGILNERLHDLPLFLPLPEALRPNRQAYDMLVI